MHSKTSCVGKIYTNCISPKIISFKRRLFLKKKATDTNNRKLGRTDTMEVGCNKSVWCPVGYQIGSAVGSLALLS